MKYNRTIMAKASLAERAPGDDSAVASRKEGTGMQVFGRRIRSAAFGAFVLTMAVVGGAVGAAGQALILGQSNSAGSSPTSLTANTGSGTAFQVTQQGTGTALRGVAGIGIAGFFTSQNGSGVSGVVANENKYGVYAANDSANEGTGAAMRVNGKQNEGIVATSDDDNAVRGVVTGCDGFLCGANGIKGQGYSFGAGVYGDGTNSFAGVWGTEGILAGVYATASSTDIPAVFADSALGTGIVANGNFGGTQSVTTDAGGAFMGLNGVYGQTDTGFGAGVYGRSNGTLNYALYGQGDGYVTGNWTIAGTCTGCTVAAIALNSSGSTIMQGDAVALDGVTTAADGSIVLMVRPALQKDAVIGIVDRELKAAPDSIELKAVKRTVQVNGGGERQTAGQAATAKPLDGLWEDGGTNAAAGSYVRIITSGVYAFASAGPAGAAVGDALAVSAKAGKLTKASADVAKGASAGKFLGTLKDGRIVLYVNPQ